MGAYCQGVQPYPKGIAVVSPEGIFECTDPSQMDPTELDSVSKDLQIILHVLCRILHQEEGDG